MTDIPGAHNRLWHPELAKRDAEPEKVKPKTTPEDIRLLWVDACRRASAETPPAKSVATKNGSCLEVKTEREYDPPCKDGEHVYVNAGRRCCNCGVKR